MLVAQIIWYFIEGVNTRVLDFPKENVPFQKYIVLVEEEEIVFFKSLKTNRWWIEMPKKNMLDNNYEKSQRIYRIKVTVPKSPFFGIQIMSIML